MLKEYDICDACGWENDPIQLLHPNFEGGANKDSLEQARRKFREKDALDGNRNLPSIKQGK